MNRTLVARPLDRISVSAVRWSSSVPLFVLRDYQQEAIDAVTNAVTKGIRRSAVVLATGGGKTIVFSHLIPRISSANPRRRKTLILAHKHELVMQNASAIQRVNPDLKVQIDMGKLKPTSDADVVVGLVMTLVRMTRLQKHVRDEYKTIILDECHHATASSWMKILDHFDVLNKNLEINVIGFTATMERADGKALGQVFNQIVFERGLIEMVENRELCDAKFITLRADIGLCDIKSLGGDYHPTQLSEKMLQEDVLLKLATSYILLQRQYDFKSTLVFCTSIEHCKTLCGILQRFGVSAQYVTGETVMHEREAILRDFKNGKISVLCNVMVFTEGTDIPNVDSLFLARPTRLRTLLVQMIGRGLRLHPGKEQCYIVDFADTRGVGFLSISTLFDVSPGYSARGTSIKELKNEADEDLLKQEMERLSLENERFRLLREIDDEMPDLRVKHRLFDGFKTVNAFDDLQFLAYANVSRAIKKSILRWVRIRYDTWALQLDTERFFVLKSLPTENGKRVFEITLNIFTLFHILQASKFKSGRNQSLSVVGTSANLDHLLTTAGNIATGHGYSMWRTHMVLQKPCTPVQLRTLRGKIVKKIETMEKNPQQLNKVLRELDAKLESVLRQQCSDMIFSHRISPNSLCFLWNVNLILNRDADRNRDKVPPREDV